MVYNKTQLIRELRMDDQECLAVDRPPIWNPVLAKGTSQKRDRKKTESQTGKSSAILWRWHRFHVHELTVAMVICTKLSQIKLKQNEGELPRPHPLLKSYWQSMASGRWENHFSLKVGSLLGCWCKSECFYSHAKWTSQINFMDYYFLKRQEIGRDMCWERVGGNYRKGCG